MIPRRKIPLLFKIGLITILVLQVTAFSALAKAVVTHSVIREEETLSLGLVCGLTEPIMLNVHYQASMTRVYDANGVLHDRWELHRMGTGVTPSGREFIYFSHHKANTNGTPVYEFDTYTDHGVMVEKGKGLFYITHETYHLTVNAKGVITADVDHVWYECKG